MPPHPAESFPRTYAVSPPIVQHYYIQFVGDAVNVTILKVTTGFVGMAVIGADRTNRASTWCSTFVFVSRRNRNDIA
ncbi:hypothetical protein BJ878DRAFT_519800 [Calycina marina]|uniref:Rhamnogalacturonase A/B/Epimerase-like pectate lyase domain-containing protein n=1 Tax=Calycina marina TaxID=1763456 RepID=A0A9P7YXP5_9HELO|nr:hypothetical protein BJ878DRAFT_519800 [Calycina marina]